MYYNVFMLSIQFYIPLILICGFSLFVTFHTYKIIIIVVIFVNSVIVIRFVFNLI